MSPAKVLAASAAWLPHPRSHSAEIVIAFWRYVVGRLADPYRPEKHYMRGPGPKWQAKHGRPLPR